jgi:hypothetical protein
MMFPFHLFRPSGDGRFRCTRHRLAWSTIEHDVDVKRSCHLIESLEQVGREFGVLSIDGVACCSGTVADSSPPAAFGR